MLARVVTKRPDKTVIVASAGGVALLAAFLAIRQAGIGDPHTPLPGVIGFMSLTKYPPSPAFLAARLSR